MQEVALLVSTHTIEPRTLAPPCDSVSFFAWLQRCELQAAWQTVLVGTVLEAVSMN